MNLNPHSSYLKSHVSKSLPLYNLTRKSHQIVTYTSTRASIDQELNLSCSGSCLGGYDATKAMLPAVVAASMDLQAHDDGTALFTTLNDEDVGE